jgi:hypothetical protein
MATIDTFPNELVEADAALAIKAGATVENGLALSQAISLKRIADALWGIEGTSGLLQLLNPLDVRNNY